MAETRIGLSNLDVKGRITGRVGLTQVSGNYTVTDQDKLIVVDASAGAVTITIPNEIPDLEYRIRRACFDDLTDNAINVVITYGSNSYALSPIRSKNGGWDVVTTGLDVA